MLLARYPFLLVNLLVLGFYLEAILHYVSQCVFLVGSYRVDYSVHELLCRLTCLLLVLLIVCTLMVDWVL